MKFTQISNPSVLRFYIQLAAALFMLYVGWEFYQYYQWAIGATEVYTPRPPAVGAFLPIGALVSAKFLLFTGVWDTVHPAALVIFLSAIAIALVARKGFCGYLCPVGFATGLFDRLGRHLGISRTLPRWLSWLLSVPKYLLLAMFIYLIPISMGLQSIEGFMRSPYNMIVDSKMLVLFMEPSTFTIIAVFVILLGSMIIPGFWCRGLCPYGALLGLVSFFSPLAVNRDKEKCINCKKCSKACPMRIPVHGTARVNTPECQGCLECVAACPVDGCLGVRAGYGKSSIPLPSWSIPAASLLLLWMAYIAALGSGHWYGQVPPEMLRIFHKNLGVIGHY